MKKENVISEEIAENDLNNWLERNSIPEEKRDSYSDSFNIIKKAIMSGAVIINEDATLTLKLNTPIGANGFISELKFNARVNRKMVLPHLSGVKSGDQELRMLAYMAASTGTKTKALLSELMPEDQMIADNITVFFVN